MASDDQKCWISLLLRLSVASLFLAAAVPKFMGGMDATVGYFQSVFQETWLPGILVTLHAKSIAFVELILAIWLVAGWRLKWAWVVSGLTLISLAFGMVVAKQYPTAANNYFYVLLACTGLYFSQYDEWHIKG